MQHREGFEGVGRPHLINTDPKKFGNVYHIAGFGDQRNLKNIRRNELVWFMVRIIFQEFVQCGALMCKEDQPGLPVRGVWLEPIS
jgi:hypothetical protein